MWHLADMLTWLREKMAYQVNEPEYQVAQLTKQLNLAKSLPELDKPVLKDMKPSFINYD
jgi:hypothetical protein